MIHRLIKYLHNASIDYVIISGYEALYNSEIIKGDIDILFKKVDFLNIENILKAFCKIEGFKIVQIYHQELYAKNIFIFSPKTSELLNLDIYGKLHRKQTVFFTEAEVFKQTSLYKDTTILATHQEFLNYLLKKIDKNDITEVAFNYLKTLYFKEQSICKNTIKTCFNKLSLVVIKAFETNNQNILLDNIDALKKDIKVEIKLPLGDQFKNQIRIFKRILKPTGIAISFLGPDGSGKSTIIEGLKKEILPFRKTAYFHLKPIVYSNKSNSTVTTNPHQHKPYSKLKSYVKLLFFLFQYNFGWLKNIWFLKIKSTLIIFDRYYDDLIIDHKRYRYGGLNTIAKSMSFFIPKPELYFILTTHADVIYSRKQEVEYNELQNQIKNYTALANGKQYYHIDVNKSPSSIVKEVSNILMTKMNERY